MAIPRKAIFSDQEKQLLYGIISIGLPISGVELILDRRLCELQRAAKDIKGQLLSVPIDPSGKGLIHFAIELSNHDDLNFLLEFGPSLDERHPWPVFSAFEGDSVHERLEKLFRLCKPKTQAEWYDGLKNSRLEGKEYLKAFSWIEQMKFHALENETVTDFVSPGCYTPDFGFNRPQRVYVKESIEIEKKLDKKTKNNSFSRRVWNGLVKMKERLVKKKKCSSENEHEDEGFGSFDRKDVRRQYVQTGNRRIRRFRSRKAEVDKANLWRVKSDLALDSEEVTNFALPHSKTIPAEMCDEINTIRKTFTGPNDCDFTEVEVCAQHRKISSENFPMSMPVSFSKTFFVKIKLVLESA